MSTQPFLVRPPAVAGLFYPADPAALRTALRDAFAGATDGGGHAVPKAIVVPHAGYVYSGPIAASAYRRIEAGRTTIRRVVLLGPSHRVPFRGMALSSASGWSTPLGIVPLDTSAADTLADVPHVCVDDRAHAPEHSLEVQVPFLQTVLDDFVLVPVVVGDASAAEVAALLDALWGGDETLVVVSTDLSHYYPYGDAVALDRRTAAAVAALRPDDVGDRDACGARPLRGLLTAGRARRLTVETIDVRNSGDTSGDRDRVVGYGAFAVD